jgi:xylonate dehydratase
VSVSEDISILSILETSDPRLLHVPTHTPGPQGKLPLNEELLLNSPSGNLFGLSQDVGMGWSPDELSGPEILILSTQGGVRADGGSPIALGYHTGHWEVGLLVQEAA